MKKSVERLYVHLPFCIKKCPYCDYITVRDKNGYSENYINALIIELNNYQNTKLSTIYFGGGTPSILPNFLIEKLTNEIFNKLIIKKNYEFTIEVNPENINDGLLLFYKKLGINRISIGAQSFNDKILNYLGRNYNSETLHRAIKKALKYFENINIDIMFAINNQTLHDIKDDLKTAVDYGIKHIAVYNLEITEKSYFGWLKKNKLYKEISDTKFEKQYLFINKYLINKGYNHYEISTYSKSGFESRHNLGYWLNEEYIGIGASAYSYINGKRFWNLKFPADYINAILSTNNAISGSEQLSEIEKIGEQIMLNLHLDTGANFEELQYKFEKFIYCKEKYLQKVKNLETEKLVNFENNILRLTLKGKLLANLVAQEFLLD